MGKLNSDKEHILSFTLYQTCDYIFIYYSGVLFPHQELLTKLLLLYKIHDGMTARKMVHFYQKIYYDYININIGIVWCMVVACYLNFDGRYIQI